MITKNKWVLGIGRIGITNSSIVYEFEKRFPGSQVMQGSSMASRHPGDHVLQIGSTPYLLTKIIRERVKY